MLSRMLRRAALSSVALTVFCSPALIASGCAQGLEVPAPHFDPPSGTKLMAVNTRVKVTNLDDEPVICVTTDSTVPSFNGGHCANALDASRT